MKISEYLEENGMTLRHFSKITGYTAQYLIAIEKGMYKPSVRCCNAIIEKSKGLITLEDLRPVTK